MRYLFEGNRLKVRWWSKGIWGILNSRYALVFDLGRLQVAIEKKVKNAAFSKRK